MDKETISQRGKSNYVRIYENTSSYLNFLLYNQLSFFFGMVFFVWFVFSHMFLLLCSLNIPSLFQPFCSLFQKCLCLEMSLLEMSFLLFCMVNSSHYSHSNLFGFKCSLNFTPYVQMDIHSFVFISAFNMVSLVYAYVSFIMI